MNDNNAAVALFVSWLAAIVMCVITGHPQAALAIGIAPLVVLIFITL